MIATMARPPKNPTQRAKDMQDFRTEESSGDNWWTPEMQAQAERRRAELRKSKWELFATIVRDQSGRTIWVMHGEWPHRIGVDQSREFQPFPIAFAETESDLAIVGESLCYAIDGHVERASRAGRFAERARRELERLNNVGPSFRRPARNENEAA